MNTYLIDIKYGNVFVDIHGPSHFMANGVVKGEEVVRERVLKKYGLDYRWIGHEEWSRAKGIRGQIAFVKRFLNI